MFLVSQIHVRKQVRTYNTEVKPPLRTTFYTGVPIEPIVVSCKNMSTSFCFFFFCAAFPENALTFVLSALTSLLPHQIKQESKYKREDTEELSGDSTCPKFSP